LIRPADFFPAFRTILAFRGHHPDGPAAFTQVLLAAPAIAAIFDNVRTAAFPALLLHDGEHIAMIICSIFYARKKMHHLHDTTTPKLMRLEIADA
jgi:hypothetical protein